jgi:hypothetical protein
MLQVPRPDSPVRNLQTVRARTNSKIKSQVKPSDRRQGENLRRIPMKRVFLLMVVSAMLATLGFAQTPDTGSSTDPAIVKANVNVQGCLAGSDGNYTVAEDGTRQILKISTSSVDLKPHVGHDVKLVGQKSTGPVSSGAASSSFAVTELSMISEHCAAAAAAVGAVAPYPQTVVEPTVTPTPGAPAADAAASAAAAPATTVSPSPAVANPGASAPVEASAPAAVVTPPSATAAAPAVDATPAAAAVAPSSTTASAPPAAATPAVEAAPPAVAVSPSSTTVASQEAQDTPPARPSRHARKRAAAEAAADAAPAAPVSPSTNTVSPDAADVATTTAAASPSPATVTPPDVPAVAPAVSHGVGSLSLLISFVVLVVVLGTMAPLIGRWRKRRLLEQNGAENLSFTNDESAGDISAEKVIAKPSADEGRPRPTKAA